MELGFAWELQVILLHFASIGLPLGRLLRRLRDFSGDRFRRVLSFYQSSHEPRIRHPLVCGNPLPSTIQEPTQSLAATTKSCVRESARGHSITWPKTALRRLISLRNCHKSSKIFPKSGRRAGEKKTSIFHDLEHGMNSHNRPTI